MSDHPSADVLDRYRQRRLEPARLLALDDHLAACAECRERLRGTQPRHAALVALRASLEVANDVDTGHPSREELQALASGRLDPVDRELADSHLDACATCAAQVLALRDSIRPRQARVPRRLVSALGFAAAAVVLLLIGGGVILLRIGTDGGKMLSDRPAPEPTTTVVVTLNDGGGPVTLDARGRLSGLDPVLPADRERVRNALTTRKVAAPRALTPLLTSSSALMGPATESSLALIGPVGTLVASDRPVLRWKPTKGATGYKVTITDPAAGYREVAVSSELRVTEWRVAAPLARARVYSWQVTAHTPDGEVNAPGASRGEARFAILDPIRADDVAKAEAAYRGRHLVMGLLYAEAGLVEEAERELRALVAANPASPVARDLLRDLRAARR